jgi:hypothetical protein
LEDAFGDLRRTLHLQDWHAILIIIYRVITGEALFDRTARVVAGIVDTIRRSSGDAHEQRRILRDLSCQFWSSAAVEFREKMASKALPMKSVKATIPDRTREMLKTYLFEKEQDMVQAMRKAVAFQRHFDSDKHRQYLLSCSHEKILLLAKKHAQGGKAQADPSAVRRARARFLQKLGNLKRHLEKDLNTLHVLEEQNPVLSAYDLAECMHHIVLKHMYKKQWGPLLSRQRGDFPRTEG